MPRFQQVVDCSQPGIDGEGNAAINWIEDHSTIVLTAVVCASLAINFAILANRGVFFGGDSLRYVGEANRVFHHVGLVGKQRSYSGYILFFALLRYLHLSSVWVATVQIFVAALSGLALYELAKHLAGRMAGLLATILFLLNPDIFRWNLFVLTDALYIDFVILACWAIWKASGSLLTKTLFFAVVLFASSIRPNGWALPLIAVTYWILRQTKNRMAKLILLATVFISFGYGLSRVQFFVSGIENESPLRALTNNVIVWGYPHSFGEAPDSESVDWTKLGLRVVRNPVSTMRLAGLRVAVEFAHVRPFYSKVHNIALVLFLPAIYISAIYGFCQLRNEPLVLLMVSIIFYHTLVIAAFFADWDGRFLLYIFPLIGVLSSSGAVFWRRHLIARLQQDAQTRCLLLPEGIMTGLPRGITVPPNRTAD
jgi:4-amino-4-deoxy-L-arabinose transferase-like glycosyltransferase